MRRIALSIISAFILLIFAAPAWGQQVRNVAVSRVEPGKAIMVVKTDTVSDVRVDYGTASATYTAGAVSNGQTRHEITLAGLPSSASIYYQVTVADSANPATTVTHPEKKFSSFKPAGQTFGYTVVGDNRPLPNNPILPTAEWITTVAQMVNESPDLALHAGDIILAEQADTVAQNEAKYDAYFDVTSNLTWTTPFYMAAGSHERLFDAVGSAGYKREFTLPENNGPDAANSGELYYSFDHGDTHFVILCSEVPGEYGLVTGSQRTWLEGDLSSNSKPWTVVVVHQPLFGTSGTPSHAIDPWNDPANLVGQQNRTDIIALFEQYGVDVVFQGHDHYYMRHIENGIQYVVTGGGGSPLYPLPSMGPGDIFAARAFHHVKVDETPDSMTVSAIDTNGVVLESFTLGTPVLGLTTSRIHWANYSDYLARELSVDYLLDSRGAGDALAVQIIHAQATNGVLPISPLPLSIGDLAVSQGAPLTMKYLVPFGVSFFNATSYAACNGLDGSSYNFPGSPPGI